MGTSTSLLCFLSNAFQMQHNRIPITVSSHLQHPPYISSTGKKRRMKSHISMSGDDDSINKDINNRIENDDGDILEFPHPSREQKFDNIPTEFIDSSAIDWEPVVDIEELDDFFDIDIDEEDYPGDEYVNIDELEEFDKETLLEILGLEDDGETITIPGGDSDEYDSELHLISQQKFDEWEDLIEDQLINAQKQQTTITQSNKGIEDLERALMEGVVPADAGVGSGMLPGDEGFDPLGLSTKDYFNQIQSFILGLFPERKVKEPVEEEGAAMPTVGFVGQDERPPALILRDYRECEIRHGRLAMLAAVIWPLQEILDRIFIPNSFGSTTVIYGGPTMPFLPLIMTFLMLNLGYLDVYSSEIKEKESGDAFLPGECFWDPIKILQGASDSTKRNMQEREILNGRAAMIAVAAYIFEETMTHKPIIQLPTNALLFEPAYQIPFIQEWLDMQFGQIEYVGPSELQLYIDLDLFI